MMRPIRFRPAVRIEFQEAVAWYDEQAKGVGRRFAEEVEAKLQSIQDQPELYPLVLADVREATLLRFPYTIYVLADPDETVVVSVFHHSRDPSTWQTRADDS